MARRYKRDYSEYIAEMKTLWVGARVEFEGTIYTVVDVDYNGSLMIDKPARFTETTAVSTSMVKRIQD